MSQDLHNDLYDFIAVLRAGSLTKAAAELRVSQPTLSAKIKRLEDKLGASLFIRKSRGVEPTEKGSWLFEQLSGEYDAIETAMRKLTDMQEEVNGVVRITAIDYAIKTIIWPKLKEIVKHHPKLQIEINNEYESVDIVSRNFDAGVRFGEEVALDMISVRIGPDMQNVVVGSKEYFENKKIPFSPYDLADYQCVNLRTSTYGGLYEWEFEKEGKSIQIAVNGSIIFNNAYDVFEAVKAGYGLAFLPEDMVQPMIETGELISVLKDWCPLWPGVHLYGPNRRNPSRAMNLVVDTLRYSKEPS